MRLNGDVTLTPEEWRELAEDYGLAMSDPERTLIRSIPVSELLDPQSCAEYLDWLTGYIGAPSPRVAASMLAKRYGYLLASPVVYAMTRFNKALLPTPQQCVLITPDPALEPGRTTFPDLALTGYQVWEPGPEGRRVWRERVLRELFDGHLTPLLQTLAKTAQVSKTVLWENVFVRIAPLLAEAASTAPHSRDDAAYVLVDAAPELFGERRHPFARFMPDTSCGDLAAATGAQRRTCCYYYEMSDEYCRKCPMPANG